MRLSVVTIGKPKDAAITALCDEYVTRARRFIPVDRAVARNKVVLWERATAAGGPVVLLDERGQHLTSIELARWLEGMRERAHRQVTFLIGDADGFDQDDRDRADRVLALSKLTLPHRLALLLVCEQLYRAGTILAGHPYHHA